MHKEKKENCLLISVSIGGVIWERQLWLDPENVLVHLASAISFNSSHIEEAILSPLLAIRVLHLPYTPT